MKLKPVWTDYLHQMRKKEVDLIFSGLPSKFFSNALELGCGDGYQGTLLSGYCKKLITTDFTNSLDHKSNINFIAYDAEKISDIFNEGEFDFIYSSSLLEHLPNPQKALEETFKILDKEGLSIHYMPSVFWKIGHILLFLPNKIFNKIDYFLNKNNSAVASYNNNPKKEKKIRTGFLSKLIPSPHGFYNYNWQEFYAFSRTRWKKEFVKSGFEVIKIVKGPVMSGYGFGFNRLRKLLENLGFSSVNIFIVRKKYSSTAFERFFIK